jgi:ubiquitin-protein ligase
MPESVRERRLYSEYRRLSELAAQSDRFVIEEAIGDPPERYVVRFGCRGVIRLDKGHAVFGEEHRVQIGLVAEFPMLRPHLVFISPIFHPNVSADGRVVCISQWYPTQYLDTLCLTIWRLIQYKNFDPFSPLHVEAAEWALLNAKTLPVDSRPLRRSAETTPSGVGVPEIRLA